MSIEKLPTVLITGCTDGSIGHGLVLSFVRQGYHVFATARRLSAMTSLTTIPNITLLELDVTSPESIRKAHSAVSAATSGKLDILYNNAGVRYVAMGIDSTYKIATDTMATNFCAVVEMVHVFSCQMKVTCSGQCNGGTEHFQFGSSSGVPNLTPYSSNGKIVFTSSGAGKLPVPTQAIYNASKAALDLYAQTLRIEMQPLGVGVINVITGSIATAKGIEPMGPLDADSPYRSIEKDLNRFWKSERPLMDLTTYSDAVVKKVTGKNPPELIWLNSDFVWWVYFLKLTWLLPILMAKEFGLKNLKRGKA
ncbi:hypothetical protein EG329_006856 [Mollisiaceae sp. DMI_Dod_QoI]|nr:hypothetical protein EG329_006856 [Helotiales sp. DMI_Dod_QoI]